VIVFKPGDKIKWGDSFGIVASEDQIKLYWGEEIYMVTPRTRVWAFWGNCDRPTHLDSSQVVLISRYKRNLPDWF
jgi:hypothetical protein